MKEEHTVEHGDCAIMRAVLRLPTQTAQQAWRQRKREKGLCIVCGVQGARVDRVTCQSCQEARNQRKRSA